MIWKRSRISHREKQNSQQRASKQADLEMLVVAAGAGEIDLLYQDESGCCLWSGAGYSDYFRGEQKRQEQTKKRGQRVSIMGLWQPLISFICSMVLGSFKSHDFIALMDEQAKVAAQTMKQTGRIRVIVLDNGSIHTSKAVKEKILEWQAQGLYLFFLAAYCSEMNLIELEWEHLKRDELAGQMFESEPELGYHITEGLEARGERHKHTVEYVNLRPMQQSVT